MNDERFVDGVALSNERKRRSVKATLAGLDTAAVINDESKADRNIFMFEDGNRLNRTVFDNPEIFLGQASDRSIPFVHNRDMEFDEIDIHIECERRILGPGGRYQKQKGNH